MAILNSAQLDSSIINPDGGKVSLTTLSNTQRTNQIDKDVIIEKSTQKDWALPQDEILVTAKITNNMDINLEDFHFVDTLSKDATFVVGSLKVGNEEKPDLNPIDGFDLAVTIGGLGGECEISYKILVAQYPEEKEVSLFSTINFTLDEKTFNLVSNTAKIIIVDNEIYILKSANTNVVKSGEEITYTIQITNNGNLENTELFFRDSIPTGTTFVEESVKVNSVQMSSVSPENGFSLNDLPSQGEIVIEFKVRVD